MNVFETTRGGQISGPLTPGLVRVGLGFCQGLLVFFIEVWCFVRFVRVIFQGFWGSFLSRFVSVFLSGFVGVCRGFYQSFGVLCSALLVLFFCNVFS